MEIPELMGIANELGVEVSPNSELSDVIYAIIDKAAESAASEGGETTKRKRTRITKKDTNKTRQYVNFKVMSAINYMTSQISLTKFLITLVVPTIKEWKYGNTGLF